MLVLETIRKLDFHGAILVDGFCSFAGAIREELLHFPHWKAMRLGGEANHGFQTAITTGHLQGRFPELEACARFAEELGAAGQAIADAVGNPSPGALRVDLSGMAYGQDGRLKLHTDSILERRAAWMLYLVHPDDGEWSAEDGGCLALSDAEGREQHVYPRFNRFVSFRVSDASRHAIAPILRPTPWERCRLALSGWLHA
jgi:hypothetical protein